jgi:hypothetical protein
MVEVSLPAFTQPTSVFFHLNVLRQDIHQATKVVFSLTKEK